MPTFIKIKNSYNPLTTQGERPKWINADQITHITNWPNLTNKRISTIRSRIKMSDGEILEVNETVEQILALIKTSKLPE